MVVSKTDGEETVVERTDNKNRERPNDHRHGTNSSGRFNLGLLDSRDFEWMAWQFRTYKNEMEFILKRDMIAQLFYNNFWYLPTQEEIIIGIILAQLDQL